MMGDHYPLAATFIVGDRKDTGIETVQSLKEEVPSYYNLNGQRIGQPAKGVTIEVNGKSIRKHIIK